MNYKLYNSKIEFLELFFKIKNRHKMPASHVFQAGLHKEVLKFSLDGASVDITIVHNKNTGLVAEISADEKMEDLAGIRNLYWTMIQDMLPLGVAPDADPLPNERQLLRFCRERYAVHNAAFFA